jgi:ribonuclease BN (tRNA processing enzyme)
MRLIEIGCSASYEAAGEASASHLVQDGDTSVLLDCGNGALSVLGRHLDPLDLSAVIVTHEHIDHFGDVYALQAALRFAPEGPKPPLPLFGPPGLIDRMSRVLSSEGAAQLVAAFHFVPIAPGMRLEIGELAVTTHESDHMPDSLAIRVRALDGTGGTLAYTSDTAPGDHVTQLAEGASILLAEATMPGAYEGRAPHLSPAQAARYARDAGVDTLVLTHLWPTADREALLAEARAVWDGHVVLGTAGLEIDPV